MPKTDISTTVEDYIISEYESNFSFAADGGWISSDYYYEVSAFGMEMSRLVTVSQRK